MTLNSHTVTEYDSETTFATNKRDTVSVTLEEAEDETAESSGRKWEETTCVLGKMGTGAEETSVVATECTLYFEGDEEVLP